MAEFIDIEKAVQTALEKFTNEKWHCAESSLYGLLVGIDFPNAAECVTAVSGFNGGIGGSRNMCGAISGSIAAAGFILGRNGSAMQSIPVCSRVSGSFYKEFQSHFNTVMCSELTKKFQFASDDRRLHCRNMVQYAVQTCGNKINEAIKQNVGKTEK